jgi:hypothetical protein
MGFIDTAINAATIVLLGGVGTIAANMRMTAPIQLISGVADRGVATGSPE